MQQGHRGKEHMELPTSNTQSIHPHTHTDKNKVQKSSYNAVILALPVCARRLCVYPCHLPVVLLSESTLWLLLKERERRKGKKGKGREGGESLKNLWGTSSRRLSSSLTLYIWPSSLTVIFLFSSLCPSDSRSAVSVLIFFLSASNFLKVQVSDVTWRCLLFFSNISCLFSIQRKRHVSFKLSHDGGDEMRLTCIIFSAIHLIIDIHR